MKIIHNNAAEVKVDANVIDRPKLRIRGSMFYYTPRPRFIPKIDRSNWPTITLIYRGSTYQRKIKPLKFAELLM